MTTELINDFLVLAELKNYSAAADQLFISQASLSRHIVSMETELDVKLFNRSSKYVELTDAGIKFMPYAKHILEVQDNLQKALYEKLRELNDNLILGINDNMENIDLDDILERFCKQYPRITIDLFNERPKMLKKALLTKKCDVVLLTQRSNSTEGTLEDPAFKVSTLKTDTLSIVLPRDHPLAKSGNVSLEDIQDSTLIFPDRVLSEMLWTCEEYCIKTGNYIHSDDSQAWQLMEEGFGIILIWKSMLPKKAVWQYWVAPIIPLISIQTDMFHLDTGVSKTAKILFTSFMEAELNK